MADRSVSVDNTSLKQLTSHFSWQCFLEKWDIQEFLGGLGFRVSVPIRCQVQRSPLC